MPFEPETKEITALLATLGAQLAATNQRLDVLSDQVGEIRTLLTDREGVLIRVDRIETAHKTLWSLPPRVDALENWQRTQSERLSQAQQSSENLKSRLFYPLILALVLATLGLAWALLTHQTVIGPVVPPVPAPTPHIFVDVLRACAGNL